MTEKRLDVNSIDDLFVREELIRLYEENEQLKQRVKELEDNIITKLNIIQGDVE